MVGKQKLVDVECHSSGTCLAARCKNSVFWVNKLLFKKNVVANWKDPVENFILWQITEYIWQVQVWHYTVGACTTSNYTNTGTKKMVFYEKF